jgi:hypothetical protein
MLLESLGGPLLIVPLVFSAVLLPSNILGLTKHDHLRKTSTRISLIQQTQLLIWM